MHIRSLRLLEFLTSELPCPPSPLAPAQPVISEKTTNDEKEKLLTNCDDRLTSYESQFHTYMTWLDEDVRVSSVLIANMKNHFTTDIVSFDQTHQM
jgi:hypothetical protein